MPMRMEIKIPLPVAKLPEVEAWIRVHPAHWRRAYPPRQVNNVYFETPDFDGLRANLWGLLDRAKLRMRWYGSDLARFDAAQLELKSKRGTAGWKEMVVLNWPFDLRTQSWDQVRGAVVQAGHATAALWLGQSPVPVLINRYRRSYYETPDGEVRLTIDTDMRAFGQLARTHPNLDDRVSLEPQLVIELKAPADPNLARRLASILSQFPVRVDRFSKYVNALLAMPYV
jgi:hypothetical protein